MRGEQGFEALAQGLIRTADGLQEGFPFAYGLSDCQREESGLMILRGWHRHLVLNHLLIHAHLFDRKYVSVFKNVFRRGIAPGQSVAGNPPWGWNPDFESLLSHMGTS